MKGTVATLRPLLRPIKVPWNYIPRPRHDRGLRFRQSCSLAILLLLVLAACGSPDQPPPWVDGRFEVGGIDLYLHCVRPPQLLTAIPTIVLEHGIGRRATSAMWTRVQSEVAAFAPVCRYDRAGVGASGPPRVGARTGQDLSRELRTLLTTAGVAGPYVLVGHSFGGYPVRLYAHTYRTEVVGLVLVDAPHEEMIMEIPLEPEALSAAAIGREVQAAGPFGAMPLVVVTRGLDRTARWDAFQTRLLALSTNSKQIIAAESDHQIPVKQPAAVVDAIRQVLDAVQNQQPLK